MGGKCRISSANRTLIVDIMFNFIGSSSGNNPKISRCMTQLLNILQHLFFMMFFFSFLPKRKNFNSINEIIQNFSYFRDAPKP